MNDIAKILIIAGLGLLGLGVLWAVLGKIPGMGKLPGDVVIKKNDFTFYFPLATCILLSVIFTLITQFFIRK
jgi:hypothetical protein